MPILWVTRPLINRQDSARGFVGKRPSREFAVKFCMVASSAKAVCIVSLIRRIAAAALAVGLALSLGTVATASAQSVATAIDYDPQSSAWNGLVEFVRLSQTAQVELRTSSTLDWSAVRHGDGLLVLYPLSSVDLDELSAFLEDGGRLALFDDFGTSEPLLRWFQVQRSEAIQGTLRSPRLPGFYNAYRQGDHVLGDQIDSLVTNEPVVLRHARLSPAFSLSQDPSQGVILAGQVGRGRLVIGGDPSILINSMLRFSGNRQFALNLLSYLAPQTNGRIHLVTRRFSSRGTYEGTHSRRRSPLKLFSKNLDETLARAGMVFNDPTLLRLASLFAVLLATLIMAAKIWGPKPSDRFGPTAPGGPLAGVAPKVLLFGRSGANLLYPTLVLRRLFERALLRELELMPPTDIARVVERAEKKLTVEQLKSLRSVLVELDAIANNAEDKPALKVSGRRFVSLWRRISAILAGLSNSKS